MNNDCEDEEPKEAELDGYDTPPSSPLKENVQLTPCVKMKIDEVRRFPNLQTIDPLLTGKKEQKGRGGLPRSVIW